MTVVLGRYHHDSHLYKVQAAEKVVRAELARKTHTYVYIYIYIIYICININDCSSIRNISTYYVSKIYSVETVVYVLYIYILYIYIFVY